MTPNLWQSVTGTRRGGKPPRMRAGSKSQGPWGSARVPSLVKTAEEEAGRAGRCGGLPPAMHGVEEGWEGNDEGHARGQGWERRWLGGIRAPVITVWSLRWKEKEL